MNTPGDSSVHDLAYRMTMAADRADLEGTSSSAAANCQVTYIVPWKKPLPGPGRPARRQPAGRGPGAVDRDVSASGGVSRFD